MTYTRLLDPHHEPIDDSALHGYLLDGTRRRVLLAEDDLEMRRLVTHTLLRDGYEVVAVQDGSALLDALRTELDDPDPIDPYDLVITDVRMPGWNGLDGVELLRANRCLTPVLVVTAFGDEDVHRRAHQLEASILDKPFEMAELSRTVFEMLSLQPSWGLAPGFDVDEDDEDAYLAAWGPVRRRRPTRP